MTFKWTRTACVAGLTTMIVIGEITYGREGTGNKKYFHS